MDREALSERMEQIPADKTHIRDTGSKNFKLDLDNFL